MNRERLMLELTGLSRVINKEVRNLVYKRQVVEDLAYNYEPENPFLSALDEVDAQLREQVEQSIFENLGKEERKAFLAQWSQMHPQKRIQFLEFYVLEDAP